MTPRNPSLIAELCRVFHAKAPAIGCALAHRQITVDGYLMRAEFDRRWTQAQLRGRTAAINYRTGPPRLSRLYA